MKHSTLKISLITVMSAISLFSLQAQNANTIKILPDDTKERIIEKSIRVVPSPNQLSALQEEFIAFIHFGPNTFTRKEWGNGMEDPAIFDLKSLDTDQWCRAMKRAGMKKVILTVKHHDGFVLWQSRYTTHGIMSTGFKGGKGDILKELSNSCRKYGLKLGIYLSPADLFQIESPEGLYGNGSSYTLRTIPREVPGRPFCNTTRFDFVVDDYNEYFLNQLFELLTEYGPVSEVWFDGAHPKRKGDQKYNYAAWKELIRTLAPNAVIFGREDIRWCGNEAGATRDTEWNVITYPDNPDTTSIFPDRTEKDLGSREKLYQAQYLHYQPAETNTSIREGWFYRDDERQGVRSADDLFDIYERSVGGNSIFLLNIPPNREGCFSARDIESLHGVGEKIRKTYGKNLLKRSSAATEVRDNNIHTFISAIDPIEITFEKPVTINRIMLQEPIGEYGERIESHAVDIWDGNVWREVASATNIGHKRILRFPETTTSGVRIRVLQSRGEALLSHIGAHYYRTSPPALSFHRGMEGIVTIEPKQHIFNWNRHGENPSANINTGMKIFYTTDGSMPDTASTLYERPFLLGKGELRAIAWINGEKGDELRAPVGYIKKEWDIKSVTGDDKVHPFIEIDLGNRVMINGISYSPSIGRNREMMASGDLWISQDGEKWREAGRLEFGNLINDPSTRYHYLSSPVEARYIKIVTLRSTVENQIPKSPITIEEIEVL